MPLPSDWSVRVLANGVAFNPPGGVDKGGIRITERRRPLKAITQLAAETLAATQELIATIDTSNPPEHIATAEGEYAALATFSGRGRVDQRTLQFGVAAVYGDDFYDRIDMYAVDEADPLQPLLHDYVFGHRLGLGSSRHRRFLYTPPEGWVGIERGLMTEWIPPDFPRHYSRINVGAAMPEKDIPASEIAVTLFYRRILKFQKEPPLPPENVQSKSGVHGIIYRMSGRFLDAEQRETEMISGVLRDERFVYPMRLETTTEFMQADMFPFMKTLQSVQPIPRPVGRQSDVFVLWSE
jgi:hypothetical protein